MSRIRTCASKKFFTGKSVCDIDYDKIKAVILFQRGQKLSYDTLANLRTQCHADMPTRAYGLVTVINWETSGGEVQTSQVGYGPNAYNGVSARTDTFTLDKFRHYLRAALLKFADEEFDMYLIDCKDNLYGLDDGTDTLAGIPVTIYPSGNDHPGASDKESLAVNVVYSDTEGYMLNLDVVPLSFSNAVSGVYGLMPVDLVETSTAGKYKIVEHYGKGDATAKFGALLAENATTVFNAVSAASYDAVNEVLSITATASGTPSLKAASVLAGAGIYGIEPYTA